MTLETFFEKFERFADAPGAVGRLRELVLELAMRGRLVEQKESDGNANSIFGKTKFETPRPRFDVPGSWIWLRFADVGEQRLGKMLDQRGNRGDLKPYLRNTNVQWMRFELDDIKELRLETEELDEYRLVPGDLLICEGGEPGRCAIWSDPTREMYFQKAIHRVRPRPGVLASYLAICLRVDSKNGVLEKLFTGATIKHLTGRSLREYPIPLPPLAEQKRIVAKVDELMALCDRLEAQQQEREAQHAALARASLARFVEAPTPANLDFLFHKSYSIPPADLRKSILTLAVQGHLSDGANPGEWPSVTMREACLQITDGEHATPQRTSSGVPLATAKNVRDGFLDLTNTDYVAQSTADKCWKRCKPRDQDILMVCVGATTGRVCLAVNPPDMVLVRSVALLRPNVELIAPRYLDLFLRSPAGQSQVWGNVKQSAQPCLYLSKMANFVLSLPPVVEQLRIVAKVDELMTLVDALEAQLATAHKFGSRLLDAVVAELTQGRALA